MDIKKPYKSILSIQAVLNDLKKYTEAEAIEMIDFSIRKAYQGIYKENQPALNGTATSKLYKKPEERDDSW